MIDTTFDLFVDLGATDEQCDFPVVYASGANGIAGDDPETLAETLEPLFECIVREVCHHGPPARRNPSLQLRGNTAAQGCSPGSLRAMLALVEPCHASNFKWLSCSCPRSHFCGRLCLTVASTLVS